MNIKRQIALILAATNINVFAQSIHLPKEIDAEKIIETLNRVRNSKIPTELLQEDLKYFVEGIKERREEVDAKFNIEVLENIELLNQIVSEVENYR